MTVETTLRYQTKDDIRPPEIKGARRTAEALSDGAISEWGAQDVPEISELLEKPCWAPWLQTPPETMHKIIDRFPAGQLLLRDSNGEVRASLTMNRIDVNTDPENLMTWDEIAGSSVASDYPTYKPEGSHLVFMSMNTRNQVTPTEASKKGLATQLLNAAIQRAGELGTGVASSFRPVGYGEFKAEIYKQMTTDGNPIDMEKYSRAINFTDYCARKRPAKNSDAEELADNWLRVVSREGMELVGVRENSMTVTVDQDTFNGYRNTYQPDKWFKVGADDAGEIWECGETGSWHVKDGQAVYTEPNMWGIMSAEKVREKAAKNLTT